MVFHCIIQQKALCYKILAWKDVTDIVISTINYIQKTGLGHRQFQQFLVKIEAELLYFTDICW